MERIRHGDMATNNEILDDAINAEVEFTCPGEHYPISRSVHLSRLASFYPKCRDCEHRGDTGQLPQQTVERLQSTERRIARESLFVPEGIRGVYLNEMTRKNAGAYAGALASLLWDESPLRGRVAETRQSEIRPRRSGPQIVVGYDERSSSPDIMSGVVSALQRMNCDVIDIGVATRPCFDFAVDHLQAMAGVLITGSGCAPSWTGLEFVGKSAIPFSQGGTLDELDRRHRSGFGRPTRNAGRQWIFRALGPYQASLRKHFHAVRPLIVYGGCVSRLLRNTMSQLFEKLPCQLKWVDIPQRRRDFSNRDDLDLRRIADAVCGGGADLGILIDDDGSCCGFVDDFGRSISAETVTQFLAEDLVAQHPGKRIVIEAESDSVRDAVIAAGGTVEIGGPTRQFMYQTIQDQDAAFGGGSSGRFWVKDAYPACDAILTLSKMLQALSRSDRPFSRFVS